MSSIWIEIASFWKAGLSAKASDFGRVVTVIPNRILQFHAKPLRRGGEGLSGGVVSIDAGPLSSHGW